MKGVGAGVHLLVPGHGENGPTPEIFTYADTHKSNQIMVNHTGFTHIAFEVEDVSRTPGNALQNRAALLGKITKKEIPGAGLLTFVYFRDPEGNIAEIQSWDKVISGKDDTKGVPN